MSTTCAQFSFEFKRFALRIRKRQPRPFVPTNRQSSSSGNRLQQKLLTMNSLSLLRTFVLRIIDDYQRLSSIANTTYLALKINSMANSIQILTTSVTGQQHVEVDLIRKLEFLNATVLGLQPSLNRIASIEQYLLFVNHSLASFGPENQHKLLTLSNDL